MDQHLVLNHKCSVSLSLCNQRSKINEWFIPILTKSDQVKKIRIRSPPLLEEIPKHEISLQDELDLEGKFLRYLIQMNKF